MNLGGYSATGPRDANEDNYYFLDFSDVDSFANGVTSFAMVSDGMGGYQGGDVASAIAVSSAESYLAQLLDMAKENKLDLDAPYALGEISQNAHDAILAETRERGNANMGATFIGAFLSPTHAWIGHVGDSRAYLVSDGVATQLTEDHSQVGRMLSRGLISEEEAQNHPARNRIERALGFSDATPDITEVDLQPGDALLLCSDGVYTVLNCQAIADCVARGRDAEGAATRVVKTALRKGTDDNSTAVVALNVEGDQPVERKKQPTIRTKAVPRHGSVEEYRNLDTPTQPNRQEAVSDGQSEVSQYRVENYRGRTSQPPRNARQTVTPRRRAGNAAGQGKAAMSKAIPLVVIAVLVIVVVVVFFTATRGGGGGESAAGSATSAVTQGVESQAVSGGDGGTSAVAEGAPASGYQNYGVAQAGKAIKFVDNEGRAHEFNEPVVQGDTYPNPFGESVTIAPTLKADSGVSVEASVETKDSTVYGIGGPFYDLAPKYREALIQDCKDMRANVFDSSSPLLDIVDDADGYQQFLDQLNRWSVSSGNEVESIVQTLIVDSDALL